MILGVTKNSLDQLLAEDIVRAKNKIRSLNNRMANLNVILATQDIQSKVFIYSELTIIDSQTMDKYLIKNKLRHGLDINL